MKRLLRVVAVVVGFVVLLVACGSGGGGGGEPTPATKVVDADNGSITVPEQPQRIVSIGGATIYLLEWGIQPVGVTEQTPITMRWLPDEGIQMYEAAEKVGSATELNYEKIASLKPDLIVVQVPKYVMGGSINESQLQEIAPTTVTFLDRSRWKESEAGIATTVGATAQVTKGKQSYDDLVASFRKKYGSRTADMKFGAVNRWESSENGVFVREYANSMCTVYATDAGFDFPGKPRGSTGASTDAEFEDVSMERLNDLSDLDAVMYPLDSDGKPKEEFQPVLDSKGWKSASFVREKRTLPVKCPVGATYHQGVTNLKSLEQALDKYFADNRK